MPVLPTPPKSESYFRMLFEACGEAFVVTNEQGQAIDCNDAAADLFSCQRSDILGTTPADWSRKFQSDGRRSDESAAEIFAKAAAGETVSFEWENHRIDREPVFVSVTVQRAVIDGQVCYMIVSRNISDRKATESALHEEQNRFRTLFEHSPDPVWIIENNAFIECNGAAAKILGYPDRRKLMFVHPSKLSPEFQPDGESSSTKAERMIEMARKNGINRFEWMHTRSNGEDFPAEVTLSSITLQGRAVIHCVWRDISKRRQAEDALRQSESLFRTLFEQAAVGVAQIDTASGRFLAVNRKYCEIVGYSETEMLQLDFPSITHPNDLAEDLANMDKLKSGEIRDFDIEKRYIHKNGRIVWVDLTVSPMWATGASPDKHIAIVQDISLRKEAESQLWKLARTDDLTGLDNRRHFLAQAELELLRSIRYGRPLSMLMVDADHFKSINDLHGHAVGDLALRKLADIFRATLRVADLAGRIGGEEFAVLLPETDHEMAVEVAERLRKAAAEAKVPLTKGLPLQFTVSIGVSSLASTDDNLDVLINRADEGLYLAKSAGRNHVCSSSATSASGNR